MTKHAQLLAFLGVALSLAMLVPVGGAEAQTVGQVALGDECECSCDDIVESWHTCADNYPLMTEDGPIHYTWEAGSCELTHTYECTPFEEELSDLAEVAAKGTAIELKGLITTYSEAVHFNANRLAIQVTGCSGQIIASIPISQQVAFALADTDR